MTVLTDQQVELVKELVDIRQAKNRLAKREGQLRTQLLEVLTESGDMVAMTSSGQQVLKINEQARTQVNRKRLQALHPDVYEDVLDQTTATILEAEEPRAFTDPQDQDAEDRALSALADAALAEVGIGV